MHSSIHESIVLESLPVVAENADAALLDMGDGIACMNFRSKGNSITPDVKLLLGDALERYLTSFDGMIIANQAKNFSVGANLNVMKRNLDLNDYAAFDANSANFQQLNTRIKYYDKPIVAAPYRHTLGGGLEIVMHCHGVVAFTDCFMGLVEIGVGLIPGGGGTKECAMLVGDAPEAAKHCVTKTVFEKLLLRRISRSAEEAKKMLYLREHDIVVQNQYELLPEAKALCLRLARDGFVKNNSHPALLEGCGAYKLLMKRVKELLEAGEIAPYDIEVGKRIARILTGGSEAECCAYSEDELLLKEREGFLELVHQQGTFERISHFVEKGELLRN